MKLMENKKNKTKKHIHNYKTEFVGQRGSYDDTYILIIKSCHCGDIIDRKYYE